MVGEGGGGGGGIMAIIKWGWGFVHLSGLSKYYGGGGGGEGGHYKMTPPPPPPPTAEYKMLPRLPCLFI